MVKRILPRQEVVKTLKTIYSSNRGRDMIIHRKKTSGRKILVGLLVFFGLIFVVSWIGVLFFSRGGWRGGDDLKLEILGPKNIIAGRETEYEIKYKNKENFPLASAEIGLYLPGSFILSGAEPLLGDKNSLKLGTVGSGRGGLIKIKGKFFAPEGEKHILQAVLTYKPSNFNSNFQKTANLEIEIIGSVFDGSLEGPDKITLGDEITYKLNYKNQSDGDLDNIAIDVLLPSDFILGATKPAIGRGNRWSKDDLKSLNDGEVEIKGVFSADAQGAKEIIFKLGVIRDGDFLPLTLKGITTEIVGGSFVTSLVLNSGKTNFINWGDNLNYSIVYKNEGKDILRDIKLKLTIAALPKEKNLSIIDWSALKDLSGGRKEGESLIWTSKEADSLKELKPGENGIFDFNLKVIPKPGNPMYKDYKIESLLEAEIGRVGDVEKRKTQNNKIITFVNSDVEFRSEARYFDDARQPLGKGPLPPKIGEETTYKIRWILNNSMHELEDLNVSALLPESVIFLRPQAEAGLLALDESLSKIVWSLNRLPTSVKTISAQFDLSLRPKEDEAGKILELLKEITFTARDKSTGGMITIKVSEETTAISDDPFAPKDGKVQ